jgi:membrane protein YqaA with SNARE-associated domain
MLRKLYDWTLSLAARPAAELWLGIIAFIESSIFLVPADVLFIPMALAKPHRAYRLALIATLASTTRPSRCPSSNSTASSHNSKSSGPAPT